MHFLNISRGNLLGFLCKSPFTVQLYRKSFSGTEFLSVLTELHHGYARFALAERAQTEGLDALVSL